MSETFFGNAVYPELRPLFGEVPIMTSGYANTTLSSLISGQFQAIEYWYVLDAVTVRLIHWAYVSVDGTLLAFH